VKEKIKKKEEKRKNINTQNEIRLFLRRPRKENTATSHDQPSNENDVM
jgi:hypothetical protein